MNRNTELHFSQTPSINIKRSKFYMPNSHKTCMQNGDIVPIFVDSDILPGDTVQMDMAELVRMATPIYPIMDNLYMDIYWFFTPHRLVMDNWAKFWGENDDPWATQTEYEIPQITAPEGGWKKNTIADYMGIPVGVDGFEVSALPFRAYVKTWNDWFRDQNLKQACHLSKDDTTRTGLNGDEQDYTYVTGAELGAKPLKAAKMADMFTTALPTPQKGPAVTVPITGIGEGTVTFPTGTYAALKGALNSDQYVWDLSPVGGVSGRTEGHTNVNSPITFSYKKANAKFGNKKYYGVGLYNDLTQDFNSASTGSTGNGTAYTGATFAEDSAVYPTNLYADLKKTKTVLDGQYNVMFDLGQATLSTIAALRTAFAVQKYYENAGLHGTRYIEYIKSVFGVTSSDARMQRSEYIGGTRVPLNIDQIVQTSSTDNTSPQGNTSGFSCTLNAGDMFTKSFEEHGTLMCLAVIRTEHTYQQGLDKMWTRKKWTQFYNPFFAHLSEMPLYNKEIFLQGTAEDDEVFGYQEAWAEYRFHKNRTSSSMRSGVQGSLDAWHFGDDYQTLPTLGSEWIDEPYENVDRTIAVTSQIAEQFICDFFFKAYYTRPMPVYSVPGLIDHV